MATALLGKRRDRPFGQTDDDDGTASRHRRPSAAVASLTLAASETGASGQWAESVQVCTHVLCWNQSKHACPIQPGHPSEGHASVVSVVGQAVSEMTDSFDFSSLTV
jgi:hypothetical protein